MTQTRFACAVGKIALLWKTSPLGPVNTVHFHGHSHTRATINLHTHCVTASAERDCQNEKKLLHRFYPILTSCKKLKIHQHNWLFFINHFSPFCKFLIPEPFTRSWHLVLVIDLLWKTPNCFSSYAEISCYCVLFGNSAFSLELSLGATFILGHRFHTWMD